DPRAALVLSTSGSSGRPKDVLLGRDGLVANIEAILDYLPVADHPRTAIVLPLNYSYALVGQALTTLAVGGTVVLLSDLNYPAQQAERMAALRVEGLSSVPASLRLLAAANAPPLAYVASAGGPLSDATRQSMAEAWPDARRFNQYGLTEASPRVTACSDVEAAFHRGSVGRPLRGVQVEAVDGELVVRSPAVMLGYLNDPEGTAAALTSRGLRTGDRGHVDADGYVFVEGRVDDLVKIAGERVSLDAVAAAVRTLPGVRDAAVVTLPDARTDLRLAALVVLDGDAELRAVRRAARALHPAHRPTLWAAAEALPTNARAKLDRSAVRRLLEATR
ncbi:MAG: long-chain fatty acid--CoA ligase, partial [Myxococcales bacterium]|nr:long-chain fatty acid--CoA ligase [Myxococcales bacterium]